MIRLPNILLGAALAAASITPALAQRAPAPLPRDSVYHLPVTLTDQDGAVGHWRSHRGKPQVVAMFYTSCQYICPLIIDGARAVDKQLAPAQRQKLGVLLISMDPARDTPAALKAVVVKRKLPVPRWTLASPQASQVRAVAGVLGNRYRLLADGEFNHTSALILLDRNGRVLARTEKVGARPDPEFVAAVRKAVATQP